MSESFSQQPVRISEFARESGLEPYLLQLEMDGLAVVPPDVHGVTMDRIDELTERLLDRAKELTGCDFDLDQGPLQPLSFPKATAPSLTAEDPAPSQFLIQQLGSLHRVFRDLAVNPVAVELIRSMIGRQVTRFSSHNSFVKWQGEHGYGPSLGLHADQNAMPLPWGRSALTANTNWCLTDYTKEGGALAYVPGSHRFGSRPAFPAAVSHARAVEAPRGSLIVFHGATWHGAYPKLTPGMRISIANYYRHQMVTSQEDIQNHFDRALADDCADPALFRELAGFSDTFPYQRQNQRVPTIA